MGKRSVKAWAGFCDGKLNSYYEWYGATQCQALAVFLNRRSAEAQHEDVRSVTIIFDTPPRKPRKRSRNND